MNIPNRPEFHGFDILAFDDTGNAYLAVAGKTGSRFYLENLLSGAEIALAIAKALAEQAAAKYFKDKESAELKASLRETILSLRPFLKEIVAEVVREAAASRNDARLGALMGLMRDYQIDPDGRIKSLDEMLLPVKEVVEEFKGAMLKLYGTRGYFAAQGFQLLVIQERAKRLGGKEREIYRANVDDGVKYTQELKQQWTEWNLSRFSPVTITVSLPVESAPDDTGHTEIVGHTYFYGYYFEGASIGAYQTESQADSARLIRIKEEHAKIQADVFWKIYHVTALWRSSDSELATKVFSGDGVFLRSHRNLFVGSKAAQGAVEMSSNSSPDPIGSDEIWYIDNVDPKGSISHGDKVFLSNRANYYLNTPAGVGPAVVMSSTNSTDPGGSDEIWYIDRAEGAGPVRSGDKVFLRSRGNRFLNAAGGAGPAVLMSPNNSTDETWSIERIL